MTRWHHGHSIGVGVLGGLLVASHTLLFLLLAFAGGYAFARATGLLRRLLSRWFGGFSQWSPL